MLKPPQLENELTSKTLVLGTKSNYTSSCQNVWEMKIKIMHKTSFPIPVATSPHRCFFGYGALGPRYIVEFFGWTIIWTTKDL